MLCTYYPVNFHVKNGNVDEEYMQLLTNYHDCMLAKFKDNVKEGANLRLGFQEILEEEFEYAEQNSCYRISTINEHGFELFDTANDPIVYDLAVYILHARQKMIQWTECWETLATTKDELPGDFLENSLSDLRDRGGFRCVTSKFFFTLSAVVNVLDDHFKLAKGYVKDSFEDAIMEMASLKLPPVCCEKHRKTLIPKLILEYMVIQFRLQGKTS